MYLESKQEEPNIFWDARFMNLNQLSAAKRGFKKQASQQSFGPSYFVRALGLTKMTELVLIWLNFYYLCSFEENLAHI